MSLNQLHPSWLQIPQQQPKMHFSLKMILNHQKGLGGCLFFNCYERETCVDSHKSCSKAIPAQTKQMRSSEEKAEKMWPRWRQQALMSAPKRSQQSARHLSDEFVTRTPQRTLNLLLLKISRYTGGFKIKCDADYSFRSPAAKRAGWQKGKRGL